MFFSRVGFFHALIRKKSQRKSSSKAGVRLVCSPGFSRKFRLKTVLRTQATSDRFSEVGLPMLFRLNQQALKAFGKHIKPKVLALDA